MFRSWIVPFEALDFHRFWNALQKANSYKEGGEEGCKSRLCVCVCGKRMVGMHGLRCEVGGGGKRCSTISPLFLCVGGNLTTLSLSLSMNRP